MPKHRRSATPAKIKPAYAPAPYTGTGTEVVDTLHVTTTIPPERLLAVAAWHERDRFGRDRPEGRHWLIATKLRRVAAQLVANDNAAKRVAA